MMENCNTSRNIITNLLAVAITMLSNFIITPIITEKLGFSAYSYVGIIHNIISFFTVFSYTLNSMVGRFYTVNYQKGHKDEANEYISTALFSCVILTLALIPFLLFTTFFLDKIIVIEKGLIEDVKIAFACAGGGFILSMINSVFTTGAYAKNKLYITNTHTIVVGVLRSIAILVLYKYCSAHIWYVSGTQLLQIFSTAILAYLYFQKLIPSVRFTWKCFSIDKAVILLKAGAFNAVIMMGNTLMTQVDLLVANRTLNAEIVGAYSVLLIFSTTMRSIGSAVSNSFSPTTLHKYATESIESVQNYSNSVVSALGLLLGWPSVGIACLGCSFIGIWLHKDLSEMQQILAIMMLPLGANLACTQLYVVQQAVNKLVLPAIASIITGVFNICLAYCCTKIWNMGIFGVAFSSTLCFSLRNIIFQPLYTSVITNQKPWCYYKGLIKPLLVNALVYYLWYIFNRKWQIDSIISFIAAAVILSVIYFAVMMLLLSKKEKQTIYRQLKKKRS